MPDDPHLYKSENLPQFRWPAFFEEAFEAYKGQPVNIMAGAEFLQSEPPQDSAPLTSMEYDPHHSGFLKPEGRLTISTGGPEGEQVTIDVPTIVWVFRDVDGSAVGMEVIDEENNRLVVRFA